MTPELLKEAKEKSLELSRANAQIKYIETGNVEINLIYFTKDQIDMIRCLAMSIAEKNLARIEKEFEKL